MTGYLFLLYPEAVSREDARALCQKTGGASDLAWFGSAKEEEQVRVALQAASPWVEVWIGLNDLTSEDTYVWADGSAPAYTHWASGEPNNGSGLGEQDCGRMLSDGSWNDTVCTASYPTLCRQINP